MKFTSALSFAVLGGLLAFVASLVFHVGVLSTFAAFTSAFVLLIGVSDYAPRRPLGATRLLRSQNEPIPLAA